MSDASEIDGSGGRYCGEGIRNRLNYTTVPRVVVKRGGIGWGCQDESLTVEIGTLLGGSYALQPSTEEAESAITRLGVLLGDLPWLGHPEENMHVGWGASMRADEIRQGDNMFVTVACIEEEEPGDGDCPRTFDVTHDVNHDWIPPNGMVNLTATCERGVLVGGTCTVDLLVDHRVRLVRAGMDPADPNQWLCTWRSHDEAEEIAVAAQAFCLEETMPEGCEMCSSLTEGLQMRQVTQPLEVDTNRLQVSCDPGEHLLLGNCMLDAENLTDLAEVTMFRNGFPPGDYDTWGCSWNNPSGAGRSAVAIALCLP
ncbi:hypothetical protein [Haliangium ochraceum]|nr:hypothetical protein [Haliangium ochraceum]